MVGKDYYFKKNSEILLKYDKINCIFLNIFQRILILPQKDYLSGSGGLICLRINGVN